MARGQARGAPACRHRRLHTREALGVSRLQVKEVDVMDGEQGKTKSNWSWLPQRMPRVAALIADRRKAHGDAWVNECWRRGVVELQPGWFFAREGALTVGVPFEQPEVANFGLQAVKAGQALLITKPPEVSHAAA